METGFPSPAQGYEAVPLDLTSLLIRRPSSTYLMEMAGPSLKSAGIFPKDWLIVDRAKKPGPQSVVIAIHEGEHICRRLSHTATGYVLCGDGVRPIPVTEDTQIIATVVYSIRRLS